MITRCPPKFTYNGLTIILSNRSRFDKKDLLTANGGHFFNEKCLRPETNRYCCDIQLIESFKGLLPNTKCVLLLGQTALTKYTGTTTSLSDQRGSPIVRDGLVCIASYQPQDACDIKGEYEEKYNQEAENYEDETKEDYSSDKSKGKTARSNWPWWLKQDTKKALRILDNDGKLPDHKLGKADYSIYPPSEEIIEVLTRTKGQDLYFDIETDFNTRDMRCFAFGFSSSSKIYVVPCLDLNYKKSYGNLLHIFRALAIGMRDNCTVAHYGGCFDYLVLAEKYSLPVGRRVYDTMFAQERIFPGIERSLGHCVSYWLSEPYHKGEGEHTYRTQQQADQLYLYCGKDVFTMKLIKHAQLEYARKIPGLVDSINQINESIRPLLVIGLTGIRYDDELRARMVAENDRYMTQYFRCMGILMGKKVEPLISNQKCVKYFHTMLGYDVVGRTKTGNPSLAADNLLKLKLKYDNPVIDLLLALRAKQAETTKALTFNPWIDTESKHTI